MDWEAIIWAVIWIFAALAAFGVIVWVVFATVLLRGVITTRKRFKARANKDPFDTPFFNGR